ncbi:MAG: lipase maturation factor family protein [Terriglobia bacterium]|nr:lipase maturation factor family protein [Terriglobia bacterium]
MRFLHWAFDSKSGLTDRLIPRWIFLRALGLIYFSAFYPLLFQIRGLIGPNGILPAQVYLEAVAQSNFSGVRYWFAPTLLWISSGPHMLLAICWIGLIASLALAFNFWPRGMLVVCFICYLSFIAAAQDFSSYQSDGMLLEAGFISFFFAPPGFRPRWGQHSPPSRASLFLLQWEWFRIYFESGLVKLASGDPQWRHLTAMDEYYQNGPLPTWIGWYAQHLPHWFHWSTALGTLVLELGVVWMLFLPRRFRIICFYIVTLWQLPIILTANYTFLNYLVLVLGFLLLDDRLLAPQLSRRFSIGTASAASSKAAVEEIPIEDDLPSRLRRHVAALKLALSSVILICIFYVTTVQLIWIVWPTAPFPKSPVAAQEPFRIANQYGLFATMTRGRYEIEFQGSNDGQNWTPYPFKYKPQKLNEAPKLYAPYQPRFDWNLWFASLGTYRDNMFVVSAEERLLNNDPQVLSLFAGNPFAASPPKQIRAVLWQYWFTSMADKRATGNWWRREYLGTYAPTLTLDESGKLVVLAWPTITVPKQ